MTGMCMSRGVHWRNGNSASGLISCGCCSVITTVISERTVQVGAKEDAEMEKLRKELAEIDRRAKEAEAERDRRLREREGHGL